MVNARSNPEAKAHSNNIGGGWSKAEANRASETTARADHTQAFGIRAGDGNNQILNQGQITVTASPAAQENTSIVLGEFQSLSEPELQKALSSFSPDSYGKFTKAALQSARKNTKTLHDRRHAVRLFGTPSFEPAVQAKSFSDLFQNTMALSDSPLSLDALYARGKGTQAQGRNGLWLDSFGQRGQGGTADGTGGFDSSLNGTSFGYDYAPSKGIVSGVSAGCSGERVGLGENLGQGSMQAVFTSAYGGYATKDSYLETVLSHTRNQYENSRHLSVGSITEQVNGNHGGETFSSYLRIGRYFPMGGSALLEPFAAMEYTHLYEEGFRESGAGGINLRIGASFADSPGSEFSIPEQDPGRHTARLRAGHSFLNQKGLSASVHYDGEFSRRDGGHEKFGFLRYEY